MKAPSFIAVLATLAALSFGALAHPDPSTAMVSGSQATGAASAGSALSGTRPNIVWIVVDDMRADDLQYMPRTRRLLGDRGVTFANSFSPYPLCCPARASYFTGQYTHNHRVYTVHSPFGFHSFDDSSTLPRWLRRAGYNTLYLGKYLNEYGQAPPYGVDSGTSVRYRPPGWTRWHASIDGGLPKKHPQEGGTYRFFDTTISNNGDGFINFKDKYQTDAYGAFAASLIKEFAARRKPFFFVTSYTAPHNGGPIEPDDVRYVTNSEGTEVTFGSPARPDRVKGMFDSTILEAPGAGWADPDPSDKPEYLRGISEPNAEELVAMRELTRQRAESLYVVDQAVQRTVSSLKRAGVLNKTMIVFTSDNGYYLGEQHIRQGKIIPHEPSMRTPTLIRGPGIPQGEVRYDPITSLDFAPTMVDVAGATAGLVMDGDSVLDTLLADQGWAHGVLINTGPQGVVRNTDESGEPLDTEDPGLSDIRWIIGVRTARYSFLDNASGEEELYDVVADPEQHHNLAVDPAYDEVRRELKSVMRQLRACDGEECRVPLPASLASPAP